MLSDGGLPLLRDKFVPVKINNHETTLNEVIMTFLFPRGLIKESRELVPLRSVVFFPSPFGSLLTLAFKSPAHWKVHRACVLLTCLSRHL